MDCFSSPTRVLPSFRGERKANREPRDFYLHTKPHAISAFYFYDHLARERSRGALNSSRNRSARLRREMMGNADVGIICKTRSEYANIF